MAATIGIISGMVTSCFMSPLIKNIAPMHRIVPIIGPDMTFSTKMGDAVKRLHSRLYNAFDMELASAPLNL